MGFVSIFPYLGCCHVLEPSDTNLELDCLNKSDYDHFLNDEINPYPTDTIDDEGFELGFGKGKGEPALEHPCIALKKLLNSGTFYYSADFDLTRRLQQRFAE